MNFDQVDINDLLHEQTEPETSEPVAPEPMSFDNVDINDLIMQDDLRDREAAQAVVSKDPQLANRERIAAQQAEVTRLNAETHLADIEALSSRNAVADQLASAPALSRHLSENLVDAPIMRNDIGMLADTEHRLQSFGVTVNEDAEYELSSEAVTGWQVAREHVVDNVTLGYKSGYATGEQGILWSKIRDGEVVLDEEVRRLSDSYEAQIKAMTEADSLFADAAQIVGTMISAIKNSANETAAGSGVMVGTAMMAGVAAPATAPILGAMTMGGSAHAMYEIEGGLAYKEMIENGADPKTAAVLSSGVGLVNSLIEMGCVTLLGKAFTPVVRQVIGRNTPKVAAALSETSMLGLIRDSAKAIAKGVSAEVTTEVMQEMVNIAGEQLANEFAGATFDDATIESVYERLSEIAIQTARGMVVLSGMGMIPTIAAGSRQVYKAREAQDFFTALHEGMSRSEAVQMAPDVVADAVQTMANDNQVGAVYVDAAEFKQVMEANGITPEQLEETLPGVAETLEQKAANREDLVFPTGVYAAKVAGTDFGKSLIPHVRLSQEALSANDAAKVQREQRKMIKAVMDGTVDPDEVDQAVSEMATTTPEELHKLEAEYEAVMERKRAAKKEDRPPIAKEAEELRNRIRVVKKDLEEGYVAQYDALKTRMENDLRATGAYANETEVKTNAKYGAWVVTNLARRAGIKPERVAQLAPKVVSATSGEQGADGQLPQMQKAFAASMGAVRKQHEGTRRWMRAPDGSNTNLTEEQWLLVRTPEFKAWFGDWEKSYYTRGWKNVADPSKILSLPVKRIEATTPIESKGEVKGLFQGFGFIENHSGGKTVRVRFPNETAGRVRNENRRFVPFFGELFETAEYAWEEEETQFVGHKAHPNIGSYLHYVNKFESDGNEYYIRFTVRVPKSEKNDPHVHGAAISSVELYKKENEPTTSGSYRGEGSLSQGSAKAPVDLKLALFLSGVNRGSSMAVDKNGEPDFERIDVREFSSGFGGSPDSVLRGQSQDSGVADSDVIGADGRNAGSVGSDAIVDGQGAEGQRDVILKQEVKNLRQSAKHRPNDRWKEYLEVIPLTKAPFNSVQSATEWAEANGVIGVMSNEETDGKGEISISRASISKMLHASQRRKSSNKDAHFATLQKIREVIRTSVIAESHPSFNKGPKGTRDPKYGTNEAVYVDIAYGCVEYEGELYRVKTTLKRYIDERTKTKAYAYEVMELQVLAGNLVNPKEGTNHTSNTLVPTDMVLQGVTTVNGTPLLQVNQAAWHGSPYRFLKFQLSAIGTGEGAQAHGWGLYFAQNKLTAEWYRNALATGDVRFGGRSLSEYAQSLEISGQYEKADIVHQFLADMSLTTLAEKAKESIEDEVWTQEAWDWFLAEVAPKIEQAGALYQVEIPDNDVLLEERKTLGEQTETVRNAIRNLLDKLRADEHDVWRRAIDQVVGQSEFDVVMTSIHDELGWTEVTREDAAEVLRIRYGEGLPNGKDDRISREAKSRQYLKDKHGLTDIQAEAVTDAVFEAHDAVLGTADKMFAQEGKPFDVPAYDESLRAVLLYGDLANALGGEREASLALSEAGVKGIAYEDSRDGRCFVVFDDQAVEIVEMMQQEKDEHENAKRKANLQTTGTYSITHNRITLTPNANLSTFAHEMGHWYLETLFALSGENGVAASIREDVQTMLKDFGLDSVEAWYALPMKDREVLHERFAFYVEKYLAKGEAPTKTTRGFFTRFAKWLKDVYSHFTGGPSEELDALYRERFGIDLPPLSDEVRRVLDRMVASDRSVKVAEQAEGLVHLFEQKPADMSDEDWREIQMSRDEAEAEAGAKLYERMARDEQWYKNARSRELSKLQQKAKDVREQVAANVELQIESRPEFRLAKWMRDQNVRMTQDDLRELGFDGTAINKLRHHGLLITPTKKNAESNLILDPSTIREMGAFIHRYATPQKLVAALLVTCDRKQLVDKLTTEKCLRDHSELFKQKEMDAAVTEALHSEARGRMLATELAYLSQDKMGRSRVYREAARRAAEQMVAKMPIGKVSVRRFLAAQARASRAAAEAIRKGDRYGAVMAKRAELVQHEAAMIAIDIERKMKRVANLKARIFKADKQLQKTHDMDLVNVARLVLTNEGLGKTAPSSGEPSKVESYLKKLQTYDKDKYDTLQPLMDGHPYRGDIRFADNTVEYAMQVIEDVERIIRMARDAKRVMLEGKSIDRDEVVEQLVDRFEQGHHARWDGGKNRQQSEVGKLMGHWLSFRASLMRVEQWCHAMDGGMMGPFFNYIFRPVREAAAKYRNRNTELQLKLLEVLKPMLEQWSKVREIEAPELGYTFATKQELIGAILHTGNLSNKHKMLLGGRGKGTTWGKRVEMPDGSSYVDTSAWDGFFARMIREGVITKADMDAVQAIWDLLESTKPMAQKAFHQMYGTYFEEVEAQQIVTPFGTYRGGYVPAVTDASLVAEKSTQEEAKRITEQDFVSQMPVHQPGFSKSRVPNYTKPLALDVGLLCGHVQEVVKFATIAPVAQEVGKVLADKRIADMLNEHDPKLLSGLLVPWLKRSYEQTVSDGKTNWISKKLNQLRGIAGMNIMCGHIVNALQQWTGLSIAATKVHPRYLAKAFADLMHNRVKLEEIMEQSDVIKSRIEDRSIEYQTQIERIVRTGETVGQAKGLLNKALAADAALDPARDWANRHGYLLQTMMQAPIDAIVWAGAYLQSVDNGMAHEDAVAVADSVVTTTQSDFSPESISGTEAGSAFYRAFLVFYNYFNMQANLLGESWEVARQTKQYGRFGLDALLIAAVPSILSALLAQMVSGFDTGDDDEWGTYDALRLLIAEPLKNVIAMVPFLGGFVNSLGAEAAKADMAWAQFVWGEDPFASKPMTSPAVDLITSSGKSLVQMGKAAEGDDVNARSAVRNTLDLMSVVTRMPLGALKKPLGYAAGVAAGDIQPEGADDMIRGALSGKDVNK